MAQRNRTAARWCNHRLMALFRPALTSTLHVFTTPDAEPIIIIIIIINEQINVAFSPKLYKDT